MVVENQAESEHEELVAELPNLEKLSAEARLLAAKKRRLSQLHRYEATSKNEELFPPTKKKGKGRRIVFEDSITLIEAAARNDAEEVKELLKQGVSPDLQNQDGLSALHQAVIEDCDDVVHALVQGGASLNIKDADLWTPLHAAVACENYDLVVFLVENDADMVAINADGNMPIDLNDDNENQQIEVFLDQKMSEKGYTKEELENIRNAVADEMMADIRDIVQNGRELNVVDHVGATLMHIAAANGYDDVIEYLIENGALIDLKDKDGWQPIHAAACWGQDMAIEILFNHGADLDANTNDNETPFDLTEDEDILEIMKELKESGRKIAKSVKRSQSNSSRTLCVRRLSLVDKHQTSKSDAVNEGMFFQKPEVMNVMINADDENEDEDHRRESFKGEQTAQSVPVEPKKTPIVQPPMRPPSINRNSAAEQHKTEEEIKTVAVEKKDVKVIKQVESSTVVDQSSVTITIGDGKKSPVQSGEPSLVSYKKKCSASNTDTAPMAVPEIDSPVAKKEMNVEQELEKASESNNDNLQQEINIKPTEDQTRNGKVIVKDDSPVKKKCCCLM